MQGPPDGTGNVLNFDAAACYGSNPGVTVSLSPQTVSLSQNQTQQFIATVTGSANTAVTWSLSPNMGTLVAGLYTAPSSISVPQTVTVTATSQADPTQSASATVMLNTNPPTVATLPASATPNPVVNTATALSVLGADDGAGNLILTYTWATTGHPSGHSHVQRPTWLPRRSEHDRHLYQSRYL